MSTIWEFLTLDNILSSQTKNVYEFLAEGKKALFSGKPQLPQILLSGDVKLFEIENIDKIAAQSDIYEMIIIAAPFNQTHLQTAMRMLPEQGKLLILINGSHYRRCMNFLKARLLILKCFHRKYRLFTGYLIPDVNNPYQYVSSERHLSRQYYHRFYHWDYSFGEKWWVRVLKHCVYQFNLYMLTESNNILWIEKNAS